MFQHYLLISRYVCLQITLASKNSMETELLDGRSEIIKKQTGINVLFKNEIK